MRAILVVLLALLPVALPAAQASPPMIAHERIEPAYTSMLSSSYAPSCAPASSSALQPAITWLPDGGFVVAADRLFHLTGDGRSSALLPGHLAFAVSPDGRWLVVPFLLPDELVRVGAVRPWQSYDERRAMNDACDAFTPTAIDLATGRGYPLTGYGAARAIVGYESGVAVLSVGSPSVLLYEWGAWDSPRKLPLPSNVPTVHQPVVDPILLGHNGSSDFAPGADLLLKHDGLGDWHYPAGLLVSADGKSMALLTSGDPRLGFLNVTGVGRHDALPAPTEFRMGSVSDVVAVALSPDGAHAAVLANVPEAAGAELHILDVGLGAIVHTEFLPHRGLALAWGADGLAVALGGGEHARASLLRGYGDAPGLEVAWEKTLTNSSVEPRGLAWSGDGRLAASVYTNHIPSLLLFAADGAALGTLAVTGGHPRFLPPSLEELTRNWTRGMMPAEPPHFREAMPHYDTPGVGLLGLVAAVAATVLVIRRR